MEATAVFCTSVGGVFWKLTSLLFCFYKHGIYYLEFLVIIPLKAEKTNYALHLGKVEELHASFLIFLEFLKLKILVINAKRQFVSSHPTTKLILYWGLLTSGHLYWVRKLAVQTNVAECFWWKYSSELGEGPILWWGIVRKEVDFDIEILVVVNGEEISTTSYSM